VNSVTVPLSAAILGLEMAGAFKALENLVMPLDRSFTAFGLLALPALSTRRARVGDSETLKTSGRLSFVAVGVALCYSALLIFAAPRIVELVYGDPFYVQYSWILVFFGVSAVLGAAGFGIAAGRYVSSTDFNQRAEFHQTVSSLAHQWPGHDPEGRPDCRRRCAD